MLLRQIEDEKLLDLELSTGLARLCRSLGSCTSHLGTDSHEEVNLDDEHGFTSLHLLDELLLSLDLTLQLSNSALFGVQFKTLFDKLTYVDHLIFLVVLQTVLQLGLLGS